MAKRGVLTRPMGNVIALLPPYCTTQAQLQEMVGALCAAVAEVFPAKLQVPENVKAPNPKAARGSLMFEVWRFSGCWSLGSGPFNF